jgi:hypothetical protein
MNTNDDREVHGREPAGEHGAEHGVENGDARNQDDVLGQDDALDEGDAVEQGDGDEQERAAEPEPAAERDTAYERLVAADPGADAEPRLGVLRAKVDAARAETPAPMTGDVPAVAPTPDELGARRAQSRRPWLVAAAVAGAVAIGGGGYAAGTAALLADGTGSAGVTTEAGAEPAVPMPGDGVGGDAATSGEAMGGGATRAEMGGAADTSYPTWFEGRAVFHASGLSTQPTSALAYALDARAVATEESARRLAAALGVEGEPTWSYGAWSAGPQDGTGPTVWLSADGSAYFSYNDPLADPWRCDAAAEGAEPSCPQPPATQVSDDAAIATLSDLMTRVGLDLAAYELEVQPAAEGDPVRWALAYQVIDGKRTGVQVSASVGDAGIAWVDGALAQPTNIGEYPVISPAAAVERLGDPRFAGSAWPIASAEEIGAIEHPVDPGPGEPTEPPAPPSPGSAISWPVSEVTITEARLGLAQHHQRDGSVLVLPAYELSDAQGNSWSVIAVAEEAMDFTAPISR